VYDEMDCLTDSADLDHAVMLFGYGTTPDGKAVAVISTGTQSRENVAHKSSM
jgi:hypothetical protein